MNRTFYKREIATYRGMLLHLEALIEGVPTALTPEFTVKRHSGTWEITVDYANGLDDYTGFPEAKVFMDKKNGRFGDLRPLVEASSPDESHALETLMYLVFRDLVPAGDLYTKLQEVENSARSDDTTSWVCSNPHLVSMVREVLQRLEAADELCRSRRYKREHRRR